MANPMPSPEEVHVWRVPLNQPPETVASFQRLLSGEERRRSKSFHFENDRRRYAVARGALRTILAGYLGAAPEALRFEQNPHGKPFLAGVSFNLSHCEDLALVAVSTAECPVGVDVEKVRPLLDLRSIEERFFSEEERAFLEAAGDPGRTRAFFTLWTRREAAAKAQGLDLQAALARVRIPAYPAGGTAVLSDLAGSRGPWSLQDLAFDAAYVGALCVQGPPCAIIFRELSSSDFYTLRLR